MLTYDIVSFEQPSPAEVLVLNRCPLVHDMIFGQNNHISVVAVALSDQPSSTYVTKWGITTI